MSPSFKGTPSQPNPAAQRAQSSASSHLRWLDIDFEARAILWRAEHDKSGREHVTPVTGEALEGLEEALKVLCELGGWKEARTVLQCYQHADEGQLRKALEACEGSRGQIHNRRDSNGWNPLHTSHKINDHNKM